MEWFYIGFGQLVRDARKKRSLSQQTLADRVSLSRTAITNVEKGRQRVPLHMIQSFAQALGVEASALLPRPLSDDEAVGFVKAMRQVRKQRLNSDDENWVRRVIQRPDSSGKE